MSVDAPGASIKQERAAQMAAFQPIHDAHSTLIEAVEALRKPGADPAAVTLVSVNETDQGQLVIFDETRWPRESIIKRLKSAVAYLEAQE